MVVVVVVDCGLLVVVAFAMARDLYDVGFDGVVSHDCQDIENHH